MASPPYLRTPSTFRRLPGEFKVGIVWAGNPEHSNDRSRSTPLALWEPVLRLTGATFYGLQLGPAAAELRKLVCANEQYYLLWDNAHTSWPRAHCELFLNAAIRLWNEW